MNERREGEKGQTYLERIPLPCVHLLVLLRITLQAPDSLSESFDLRAPLSDRLRGDSSESR